MAGDVTSGTGVLVFATITVTPADIAVLPAASRATAVRAWAPSVVVVVFHVMAYGGMVASNPRFVPSSLNWTLTTPTLSVALADTTTVPVNVVPAAGAVTVTVGEVMSFRITVKLVAVVLPTASRAVTVSTFEPSWRAIALATQLLVPVAVPLPPRLFIHVTCVTPTLSAAVPCRVTDEPIAV